MLHLHGSESIGHEVASHPKMCSCSGQDPLPVHNESIQLQCVTINARNNTGEALHTCRASNF